MLDSKPVFASLPPQHPRTHAIRNLEMPYLEWREPTNVARRAPSLDAIYIPSQSHRSYPATDLALLQQHARRIYVVWSDEPAAWRKSNCSGVADLPLKEDCLDALPEPLRINPSALVLPAYDIPLKRTFALQHARESSFETIGLLDDDIQLSDMCLRRARVALSGGVDIASFHVLDYPDVSTVDHIERLVERRPSRVSLGGNCLFVRVTSCETIFPPVYNDDWFFILTHLATRRIASLGTAKQRPYAPWTDPVRIIFEQFGDIMIEGVKTNLASGAQPFHSSTELWCRVLRQYLRRLDRLASSATSPQLRDRLLAARVFAAVLPIRSFHTFISEYAGLQEGVSK